MIIEYWHQNHHCGDLEFDGSPSLGDIWEWDKRHPNSWYDIMWGNTGYNLKAVHWADNDTKIVVKLKRA